MRALSALVVGVACGNLFCSLASAAEPSLEETVVTATRTRADVDSISVPVIVVTREEIERSLAADVGDLLRQHAGLEVARTGGVGQTASLFVRGTNSDHAVVLIDGVRINPGTIGGAAIQNLAPESIERIEVVKGPRSTLYGSDAIGGVVNLFTRAGAVPGFSGAVSGGRYGSLDAHVEGSFGLGGADPRGSVGFSLGRLESDGFPTFSASQQDRGYENVSANVFARFAATDALELRARAWRANGTSEYTDLDFDFFTGAVSYRPVSQDFENAAYALEALASTSDQLRTRVGLTRVVDDIAQNQVNIFSGAPDFARTRRDSIEWQTDWRWSTGNELTVGALLARENTQALSFGTAFDVDTDVDLYFVQNRWHGERQDVLVAAGLTDHETFGEQATWNAEYGVTLPSRTRISLASGTAFHAPDSTDRFGFGGNPALDPETSRQFEIGVRQPLGERHSLFATAFRNDIDNLINYVVTDPLTFDGHNENVESARIDGVEGGYEFKGAVWGLRAEFALQDPRNRTTGEQLLRRARETLTLALQRHTNRLDLGLDVQASGSRKDVGFAGTVALQRYALVNLSARYALTDRWSVQARLDNALDDRYELASGYNTARRSLTLATRYRFR